MHMGHVGTLLVPRSLIICAFGCEDNEEVQETGKGQQADRAF